MEFNCKVKIIDAIMGAGKSQSIINLINNSAGYSLLKYLIHSEIYIYSNIQI